MYVKYDLFLFMRSGVVHINDTIFTKSLLILKHYSTSDDLLFRTIMIDRTPDYRYDCPCVF